MMTVGRRMSRVFRTWCSRGSRLLLLHLVCLIDLCELLLHVVIQTLVTGFILFFVDFDTDNPLAIAARVVLSIFGYGTGNWRRRLGTSVRRW